jgi:hypothetical protein
MKTFLMTTAMAVGLVGAATAGSEIRINQSNSGNFASMEQVSGNNNLITVDQVGTTNASVGRQDGNTNRMDFDQSGTSNNIGATDGTGNPKVTQTGNGNILRASQQGQDHNVNTFEQTGNSNTGRVLQNGDGQNVGVAYQRGNGNTYRSDQRGTNNTIQTAGSAGNGNTINIFQQGTRNGKSIALPTVSAVSWVDSSNNDTRGSYVVQRGNSNTFQASQTGVENAFFVQQGLPGSLSLGSTVRYTQQGTGHYGRSLQEGSSHTATVNQTGNTNVAFTLQNN